MIEITPIPAFSDNYIWLIHSASGTNQVAVVDPGDAAPVERILKERNLQLAAILITHHHADHIGGIEALMRSHPAVIYGPAGEDIPGLTTKLHEGDRVRLPSMGLEFEVLDVPGHTAGHIAFYGHGAIFCGDTLFSGGCGRLFEGTAEQMHASLSKIGKLPSNTRVYCAHEYTISNLRFAEAVEPNNAALAEYLGQCRELRAKDSPTIPSILGVEHTVNPFLRCHVETVKQAAEAHVGRALNSATEIFAAVRSWKDGFKPNP